MTDEHISSLDFFSPPPESRSFKQAEETPQEQFVELDLLALLRLTVMQVYGSDERDLLNAFIDRCTYPDDPDDSQVIVTVDLAKVIINEEGSGG